MDPLTGMPDDDEGSSSSQHPGLPKSTLVVGGIAVAFAGIATFVLLKWTGADARSAEIQTRFVEELAPLEEALTTELTALESEFEKLKQQTDILARGSFAFCNFSADAVTITKLAATYLTESGEYRTFNSEAFGENLWKIPAGNRKDLDFPRGGWDGSVTYFALWLRAGGDEYPLAGPWPLADDHCATWTGG